jgi:hypothetical protein
MVNTVEAAPPVQVTLTVAGLNEQAAPDGSPEQAKLTVELTPNSGVSVRLTVPVPPERIVSAVGEAESEKKGVLAAKTYRLTGAVAVAPPLVPVTAML